MKKDGKQSTISPLTLIIAGVGLVAALVLAFWPSGEQPSTTGQANHVIAGGAKTISSGNEVRNTMAADEAGKESPKVASSRNPFQLPEVIQRIKENSLPNNSGSIPVKPATVSTGISPSSEVAPVETVQIKEKQPVWRGIVGTKYDQLTIISYQGKTYFLRLGDLLPGTSYHLKEVEKNYILLSSPGETLKLEREKEKEA